MKGNISNFLSKTLTTYTFLLVIIFILKLVGLDYFGIDYNHNLIKIIDKKLNVPIVNNFIQFLLLFFQLYLFTYIATKDKPRKYEIIIVTLINLIITYFIFKYNMDNLYSLTSTLILFIYFLVKKVKIKRIIKTLLIITILQAISGIVRNNSLTEYGFTISLILNLDYMLMLIIYCKLIEEEVNLCQLHGFYLQKKQHLKILLKKLQRNLDNFKKKPKVEKIEISIYIILSLFWNILSVILILFVAKLNDTFIECIFILTSFWLSKGAFGKAFHFSSMTKCFVVSNLTYYALNRVTTPLGISIIVPIILGVGLSYVTSKFVKTPITKLYKGMPEDEFNNSILKVTDKDSLQYKICHMFYIERKSELEIAHNVGYSIDNIKKIKSKINKKIKELN